MKKLLIIPMLLLLISCQKTILNEERIIEIAKKMTQIKLDQSNFDYSDVVMFGNGLKAKMIELQKNATKFEFGIKKGDFEKPFGNNKADRILIIKTDYQNIGIRLKYSKSLQKYHILGWMTLENGFN